MAPVERVESSQIKRIEALREPAAHRSEQFTSLLLLALIAQEPRKPQSGALSG
jgi:hypothetical protein